jgi:thioredoxin-like negative regulator of GroEL
MLGVAKGYLGPAAQQFLSSELHALGVNANTVTGAEVILLTRNVREHAVRLMGPAKASELADALARCNAPASPQRGGHRLAIEAADKLLSSGKLRQAEIAFRQLVEKHGDTYAYVQLARTQHELEDDGAALNTLREGAAKFGRAGDRATAVSLLAAAVEIVPADLSAHRRLAAALANQGDMAGAVAEYARFVDVALQTGDSRRALLELAYGRETLGDLKGLLALVDKVTGTHSREDAPRPAARPTTPARAAERAAERTAEAPRPSMPKPAPTQAAPTPRPVAAQPAATSQRPQLDWGSEPGVIAKSTPQAAARTNPDASHTTVVLNGASTVTHAEQSDLDVPVDMLARAGFVQKIAPRPARPAISLDQQLSALPAMGSGVDGAAIAASRAALLTSARDPRATEAAIDAARRLLALGKLQSASDVLLDFIGHGFTDREAQRLLIEVDCAIGRREIAKEKCGLLSQAYRLDGHGDVADDVERLARIL